MRNTANSLSFRLNTGQREEIPCLRLPRLQAKLGLPNDVPETRGKMRHGISSQRRDFVVCKTTKEKAVRQNGVMRVVRAKGLEPSRAGAH